MNMKHARCVSFMMTATAYNANYASAVYYVRALLALGRPASALFLIGHNLPGAVPALTSAF